jgi:threonine aldolase
MEVGEGESQDLWPTILAGLAFTYLNPHVYVDTLLLIGGASSSYVGDEKLMKNAMRVRKVLGGGMRQIGFMAAAGLYALENNVERLAEDHQRAQELAKTLSEQAYVKEVEPVETNIIIFYLTEGINEVDFLKRLEDCGVIISGMGQGKLRIVTHLGYT